MMRGSIVIITAALSMVFLGRKQYLHHWVSMIMIMIGLAAVGYIGVTFTKGEDTQKTDQTPTSTLGVVLIIIAMCFSGVHFIVQERILRGYYIDPLLLIGLEGSWGALLCAILLPIY
jgi:drug/metabolite transporter (DMT)-like permease